MRPSSTMHNPLRCNYRWEACQVTRLQHVLIENENENEKWFIAYSVLLYVLVTVSLSSVSEVLDN